MRPEQSTPHALVLELASRAEALGRAIAACEDLGALESLIEERAGILRALDEALPTAAAHGAPPWRDAVRQACERALAAGEPALTHVTAIRDAIGRALTQLDAGAHAADSYLSRTATGQFDATR
jgi:hypothetical protein